MAISRAEQAQRASMVYSEIAHPNARWRAWQRIAKSRIGSRPVDYVELQGVDEYDIAGVLIRSAVDRVKTVSPHSTTLERIENAIKQAYPTQAISDDRLSKWFNTKVGAPAREQLPELACAILNFLITGKASNRDWTTGVDGEVYPFPFNNGNDWKALLAAPRGDRPMSHLDFPDVERIYDWLAHGLEYRYVEDVSVYLVSGGGFAQMSENGQELTGFGATTSRLCTSGGHLCLVTYPEWIESLMGMQGQRAPSQQAEGYVRLLRAARPKDANRAKGFREPEHLVFSEHLPCVAHMDQMAGGIERYLGGLSLSLQYLNPANRYAYFSWLEPRAGVPEPKLEGVEESGGKLRIEQLYLSTGSGESFRALRFADEQARAFGKWLRLVRHVKEECQLSQPKCLARGIEYASRHTVSCSL